MFKNAQDALEWIQGHLPHGIKPGLARMEWVMEQLGHPEHTIRAIHVGGTNGKGSTVAFLRSILMEQFEEVGTFTSPYIVDFKERIAVNNEPLTDEELVQAANLIYPLCEKVGETDLGYPTEFEVITMISLVYFSKIHPCDLVIYEVGLGGRLDSTNIIKPLISIITNVGLDHVAYLGPTISEIAFEKAGIIKPGVPVVTTAEHPDALRVIEDRAQNVNAKLYKYGRDFTAESVSNESMSSFESLNFKSLYWELKGLRSALIGPHQIVNAAAAIKALEVLNTYYALPIEEDAIFAGLEKVAWPGRFEKLAEHPLTVLDGAHNEEGIDALIETVKSQYPDKNVHILFATLKDRENAKILKKLEALSHDLILTTFDFKRAEAAETLLELGVSGTVEVDWQQAILDRMSRLEDHDLFLITGSLYFISQVREFLTKKALAK